MNRETQFSASDTLVVVDTARRRRRNLIIAAVAIVAVLLLAYLAFGRGTAGPAGGEKGAGQVPSVSVVVPGTCAPI